MSSYHVKYKFDKDKKNRKVETTRYTCIGALIMYFLTFTLFICQHIQTLPLGHTGNMDNNRT